MHTKTLINFHSSHTFIISKAHIYLEEENKNTFKKTIAKTVLLKQFHREILCCKQKNNIKGITIFLFHTKIMH